MFLVKKNQIRNGLRFQKLNFTIINYNRLVLFTKKLINKKNNYYQHKFSQKKLLYPYFDFRTNFFIFAFYCISIFKSYRKYISLFKSSNGILVILPLIDCITFENKIHFYKNALRFIFFMYLGSILRLKYYDILFLISNLGLYKPVYSVAMGTYCIINNKTKYHTLVTIPSGKQINFCNKMFAMLGRNAGIFTYKQYFGKASYNLEHKSIINRSTAKNPVDHPNGGRTRGKMCFKTPWGLVAKKNK